MELQWSIQKALKYGAKKLKEQGIPRPLLESEILLGFVLRQPRVALHCNF